MSDEDVVMELLSNAHRMSTSIRDCPALVQQVLSAPDACDCGVAETLAALDRLLAERDRLREFYEAWWEVEKGVTDFDLHNDAVMRLRAATAALQPQEKESR